MARRAVCVGINAYPTAPLRNCVADAMLMRRLLVEMGFDRNDEIRALFDGDGTRNNILTLLAWLVEGAQPGDVLVFTYSGHGTRIRDLNGDEPDGLDEALVPVDFDWNRRYETAITDDQLRAVFCGVPKGANLTIVLDSCHSGSMLRSLPQGRSKYLSPPTEVSSDLMAPTTKGSLLSWRWLLGQPPALRLLGRGLKRRGILLSACKANEVAYDGVDQGPHTEAVVFIMRSAGLRLSYKRLIKLVRRRVLGKGYGQHARLQGNRAARKYNAFMPFPG